MLVRFVKLFDNWLKIYNFNATNYHGFIKR
jgi:hypothetical protein